MILQNAIDWIFSAALWLLTPLFDLVGIYALFAAVAVLLLFRAAIALRRRMRILAALRAGPPT
jgi:hypothetical protein